MQFKKMLAIAALSFIVATAQAKTDANIKLTGGVITPNNVIMIDVDNMLSGVDYDVYCNITSDRHSGSSFGFLKLSLGNSGSSKIFMNQRPVASNNQTNIDTENVNYLRIYKITKDALYIDIYNLDDTDTLTVDNCNAWPTITDELKK